MDFSVNEGAMNKILVFGKGCSMGSTRRNKRTVLGLEGGKEECILRTE